MGSLPVIEHFDVVEDLRAGFFSRGKSLVMDEFILEIAEEALDHGIVVAIAFTAHADLGADQRRSGPHCWTTAGATAPQTGQPGARTHSEHGLRARGRMVSCSKAAHQQMRHCGSR